MTKPIYVEADIHTDLATLWKHTQTPELHEQWDLRFSQITYLPRQSEEEPQHFQYVTRIGFGLAIRGTGITQEKAVTDLQDEDRSQARATSLIFRSDQRISLIREGRGYWKYTPHADRVTFQTQFDYETRFGLSGRWLDRFLFRPMFGFATAWSFDALRLWLEKGIAPSISLQRALIHYSSIVWIALLWGYQGLVPKLLFPHSGELAMMEGLGWFAHLALPLLQLLGVVEIAIGVCAVIWHRWKGSYAIQIVLLLVLPWIAWIGDSALMTEPFNPSMLSMAMIGLCLIASWSRTDLPQAGNCKRKP